MLFDVGSPYPGMHKMIKVILESLVYIQSKSKVGKVFTSYPGFPLHEATRSIIATPRP